MKNRLFTRSDMSHKSIESKMIYVSIEQNQQDRKLKINALLINITEVSQYNILSDIKLHTLIPDCWYLN